MIPGVISISKEQAAPFVVNYAFSWGLPVPLDTNGGHDVKWFGVPKGERLLAVIGLVAINEGIYVHGFYALNTWAAKKSLALLYRLALSLPADLYGFVCKENARQKESLARRGWETIRETNTEVLVGHKHKVPAVC